MVPVVQKKVYMTPEGTYLKEQELAQWTPEEGPDGNAITQAVAKWRQWSYYKLRYQNLPS